MSDIVPNTLAKAFNNMMSSDSRTVATMTNNDRHVLKIPLKSLKIPCSGPLSIEFLKANNINIFHYEEPEILKVPDHDSVEDENVREVLRRYAEMTRGVEPKRRITIAYTYTKGKDKDGKETSLRYVTYGAVIFRNDSRKREAYDRSAHTRTAINRLMNHGIKCELHFDNLAQFKVDLRKVVHRKGVSTHRRTSSKASFKLITEDVTNVVMATTPSTEFVEPKPIEEV
jgi:hypothetical protein